MRRPGLLLVALLLGACHRSPATLEPDEPLIASMPDPFASLPARGAAPPLVRASAVMDSVGGHLGLGKQAGDALRGHASEAWAVRLALLLDLGGDAQLDAAWNDLADGTVAATRMDVDVKREVRESQARVLDTKGPPALRRRRLLAELARTLARLGD